ncbi:serine/threonine-protein kinase [Streptomyces sp. NPDC088116]|uniref:serine/threonine-protein kinase n=1 Tax=Streptomyces sp. NPDC088116 TaxID=3365825 RepID=UPI00381EE14E
MGTENEDGVFRALEAGDPPTIAGYRISARLGEGGMGKVYLSYTPGGRPVAIKVIRPDFAGDPEFRRRFKLEVRAAERVQGLFTAPVIDSDTDGPSPWLATAYVPGPSVHAAVVEHGPLPVSAVLLMVAGIAEALQVIHSAGIVHRDLKPSNVLLAVDGPRVIDFGIARATDATSLTGSGVTIGTPAFMSPEQASGTSCTAASDIFALGQVAAFAGIGNPAFGEGASHAVLYRIVHEAPNLTGLPAELRELVERCLAKDPDGRPSLTEIIDMCREASPGTQLRRSDDWLPTPVNDDIDRREAAPAPPHTPPPATEPSAARPAGSPAPPVGPPTPPVPTQLDAAHLHAAPTVLGDGQRQGPRPGAYPSTPPPPSPHTPAPHTPAPYSPAPYSPGTHAPGTHAPAAYPGAAYQPRPYQPGPGAPQTAPFQPGKSRGGLIVALVLAGVMVLAGALYLKGNAQNTGEDDKASSGGSTASGAPAGGESPAADPKPFTVTSVNLTSGYYVMLNDDKLRPVKGDVNYAGDFGYRMAALLDPSVVATGQTDNTMTLVDQGKKGSLASCRDDTRFVRSLETDKLGKGSQICLQTASGHIGLVTLRAFGPWTESSAADGGGSQYVTVDITVWRNAGQSSSS